MTWFTFCGVSIQIGRFVFYDKAEEDGTASLCTPRGHVCFLSADHRQDVDRLMEGNPDPSWVKVSGGAVNMALADLADTSDPARVIVHGGVYTRVYSGEDAKAVMAWLEQRAP